MNEVIKRAKHLTTQIESILICARGTTQHIILQRTKINIEEVIVKVQKSILRSFIIVRIKKQE